MDDRRVPAAWERDLKLATYTHPQTIMYGNVRDQHLWPGSSGHLRFVSFLDQLWHLLTGAGFRYVLVADLVDGLHLHRPSGLGEDVHQSAVRELKQQYGIAVPEPRLTLENLAERMRQVATPFQSEALDSTGPAALVLGYAGRLVANPANLLDSEHAFFSAAEKLSHTARPLVWPDGHARFNPLVWVVDHERELPAWFMAPSTPLRRVAVPVPRLEDRMAAAEQLVRHLPETNGLDHEGRAVVTRRFADLTQGLPLASMPAIVELTRSGMDGVGTVEDAARGYRLGVRDNPWGQDALRSRLADADARLQEQVLGQSQAVARAVDLLVRSVTGLSGAHAGGAARPRGVLFLAGPTGVGKTELAKAVTELVFGQRDAYIRFDMSEFNAAHAADRLIGAPPGYVGYDAGGELTNQVRQRPFSLLLFDEIEKAHHLLLDKFLQILDDGRLTDGTGSTVHFSETVIVFTSNLGMRDASGADAVTPDTSREELERRVEKEIRRYFVEVLNRPELLNRLGDNIVVFGFIDPPTATRIFDLQLGRVLDKVSQLHGVTVEVADGVRGLLLRAALEERVLAYGGRGIGSLIEAAFVNPLSRALFDLKPESGTVLRVVDAYQEAGRWRLRTDRDTR